MLAHNVFFTLKDASEAACEKLLAAGNEYLNNHDGIKFFAIGKMVPDLDRAVNVVDYHVGLHVIFESRAAHDAYQIAPRHLTFIEESKDNWEQVRVFDTNC